MDLWRGVQSPGLAASIPGRGDYISGPKGKEFLGSNLLPLPFPPLLHLAFHARLSKLLTIEIMLLHKLYNSSESS